MAIRRICFNVLTLEISRYSHNTSTNTRFENWYFNTKITKSISYTTKMGDNYIRNASNVPSRNREPEMETDYRIMKSLKRAKSGVQHNNKITFITFFLELLVIIIVVVSWVMLRNT